MQAAPIFKSKDDVDFLVARVTIWEGDKPITHLISYTHEFYTGASQFTYEAHHVPTGKTARNTIYGVTEAEGRKLVDYWDRSNPTHWRYFVWKDAEMKQVKIEKRNKEVSRVLRTLNRMANRYGGNMERILCDMREVLPNEIKLGHGGSHIWACNSKNERLFIIEGY